MNMHIRDIAVLKQVKTADFSHVINHLSFGDKIGDMVNPLDGVTHAAKSGNC